MNQSKWMIMVEMKETQDMAREWSIEGSHWSHECERQSYTLLRRWRKDNLSLNLLLPSVGPERCLKTGLSFLPQQSDYLRADPLNFLEAGFPSHQFFSK